MLPAPRSGQRVGLPAGGGCGRRRRPLSPPGAGRWRLLQTTVRFAAPTARPSRALSPRRPRPPRGPSPPGQLPSEWESVLSGPAAASSAELLSCAGSFFVSPRPGEGTRATPCFARPGAAPARPVRSRLLLSLRHVGPRLRPRSPFCSPAATLSSRF